MPRNNEPEPDVILIVTSESAHRIMSEIADLSHLANLGLLEPQSNRFREHYLDTEDRHLRAIGTELRLVRDHAGDSIILEPPGERSCSGELSLRSYEAPWSASTMAALVRRLRRAGINLTPPPPFAYTGDPVEALQRCGLSTVREHDTSRVTKSLISFNERGLRATARLSMEWVMYRISGRRIDHHQLAFTYLMPEAPFMVGTVVDMLGEMYGHALRPWPYEKAATGRALEALLLDGSALWTDANDSASEDLYAEIESRLRNS